MELPPIDKRQRRGSFSIQHQGSKVDAIFGGPDTMTVHSHSHNSPKHQLHNHHTVTNLFDHQDPYHKNHHHPAEGQHQLHHYHSQQAPTHHQHHHHHHDHHHHHHNHQPSTHLHHHHHNKISYHNHQAPLNQQIRHNHSFHHNHPNLHQHIHQTNKNNQNHHGRSIGHHHHHSHQHHQHPHNHFKKKTSTIQSQKYPPFKFNNYKSTNNINHCTKNKIASNKQLQKLLGNASALNLAKKKFQDNVKKQNNESLTPRKEAPGIQYSPKIAKDPNLSPFIKTRFRNAAKKSLSAKSGETLRISGSSRVSSIRSSRLSSSTTTAKSNKSFASYSKAIASSRVFVSKSLSNKSASSNSYRINQLHRSTTDSKIDKLPGNNQVGSCYDKSVKLVKNPHEINFVQENCPISNCLEIKCHTPEDSELLCCREQKSIDGNSEADADNKPCSPLVINPKNKYFTTNLPAELTELAESPNASTTSVMLRNTSSDSTHVDSQSSQIFCKDFDRDSRDDDIMIVHEEELLDIGMDRTGEELNRNSSFLFEGSRVSRNCIITEM